MESQIHKNEAKTIWQKFPINRRRHASQPLVVTTTVKEEEYNRGFADSGAEEFFTNAVL